jgi:type I restriction enzyme, S subunit
MKDTPFTEARLLSFYDRLAEAEDAIPRLRRFVLDLAVRGKLVPQEVGDEPASVLLERIEKEKARLVQVGAIKARLPNSDLTTASTRSDYVPNGWVLTEFGSIAEFYAGRTPPRGEPEYWNNGDFAWVSIADMEDGQVVTSTKETVTAKAAEKIFRSAPEPVGTIIMSFKLTIGKIGRLGIPAFHNEAIITIKPHLADLDAYLFLVLPELARGGDTKGAIKGATLNRDSLASIPFPLPPLAEQHRIVAKVEELMTLLDRLDAARAAREETRTRLTAATLSRLTEADTDTPTAARFALQTLPALTTRTDQIKTLRQTILNLAVRGKLVAQDPTDEPAAELLKLIEDSPKKSMRGKESSSEEATVKPPHDLPDQWEWTTFGELPIEARVGLDRGKAQQGPELAFAYFKMNNIANDGGIDLSSLARIDASEIEVKSFRLENGDFLFNTRNSRELVGKTCVFRLQGSETFLFNNNILRARFHPDVCPDFVDIWFRSPIGKDLIEGLKSNTTNVCAIYQGKLLSYPCPLPPSAEQHRIVAKVDALMALCDQLEAGLTTATTTRSRLLEALLHEALAGA